MLPPLHRPSSAYPALWLDATSLIISNIEATNARKIVPCIDKRHFSSFGIARNQEEIVEARFAGLAIDHGLLAGNPGGAEKESSNRRAFATIRKVGRPGIRWLDIVGQRKCVHQRATSIVDRILERERQREGAAK